MWPCSRGYAVTGSALLGNPVILSRRVAKMVFAVDACV